jgi:hypothetical protein
MEGILQYWFHLKMASQGRNMLGYKQGFCTVAQHVIFWRLYV